MKWKLNIEWSVMMITLLALSLVATYFSHPNPAAPIFVLCVISDFTFSGSLIIGNINWKEVKS